MSGEVRFWISYAVDNKKLQLLLPLYLEYPNAPYEMIWQLFLVLTQLK